MAHAACAAPVPTSRAAGVQSTWAHEAGQASTASTVTVNRAGCGRYVGPAVPRKKRTISRDASGPRLSV